MKGSKMVEVNYSMSKYKITMSGHAGYGQSGNDIVCAGISAIFYNLVAVLTEYSQINPPDEPNTSVRAFKCFEWYDGNDIGEETYIIAEPTELYTRAIKHDIGYALMGFKMMCENYPEAIKINVSE